MQESAMRRSKPDYLHHRGLAVMGTTLSKPGIDVLRAAGAHLAGYIRRVQVADYLPQTDGLMMRTVYCS